MKSGSGHTDVSWLSTVQKLEAISQSELQKNKQKLFLLYLSRTLTDPEILSIQTHVPNIL